MIPQTHRCAITQAMDMIGRFSYHSSQGQYTVIILYGIGRIQAREAICRCRVGQGNEATQGFHGDINLCTIQRLIGIGLHDLTCSQVQFCDLHIATHGSRGQRTHLTDAATQQIQRSGGVIDLTTGDFTAVDIAGSLVSQLNGSAIFCHLTTDHLTAIHIEGSGVILVFLIAKNQHTGSFCLAGHGQRTAVQVYGVIVLVGTTAAVLVDQTAGKCLGCLVGNHTCAGTIGNAQICIPEQEGSLAATGAIDGMTVQTDLQIQLILHFKHGIQSHIHIQVVVTGGGGQSMFIRPNCPSCGIIAHMISQTHRCAIAQAMGMGS